MAPPSSNIECVVNKQSLAPSDKPPSSADTFWSHPEKSIRANLIRLLEDPYIKLAMRADGVDECKLLVMLTAISTKLVQGSLHFDNTKNIKYRPGVGIVLLNRRGRALVGHRIDIVQTAWQLPQGGIEKEEYPIDAALRELKEELGTDNVEIIAESEGWFTYDVPSGHAQQAWNGRWQGQRQKWFLMRYQGSDADFDLGRPKAEFNAWQWVPLSDLPALAVHFKRDLYRKILSEFRAAIDAFDIAEPEEF
jgi:putative (di)nucleoside polyphosphate hydrolase